jgi:hypothetical protein
MEFLKNGPGILAMKALIFTLALLLAGAPVMAQAERGGDKDSRSEFYGIVQARPESTQGEWVIGGRTFTADAGTEIDESEGNLVLGSCAKIKIRNGRVHEIESESMHHCQ